MRTGLTDQCHPMSNDIYKKVIIQLVKHKVKLVIIINSVTII